MSGSYEKRESIFEKTPRVWRIEPDALVHAFPAGGEFRLPWNEVRRVRLRFAPTEYKPWRYLFSVNGKRGRGISFDNGHYVSIGEFENRSLAFSAFANAVLDKVAERAPGAKLYLGSSVLNYVALLSSMLIPMAGLIWLLLTLQDWEPNERFWTRLSIIGAMLPLAGLWVVRARPRHADMAALRENLPGVET
jgi:hypothetical protein